MFPSVTVIRTALPEVPTLAFAGVPDSTPVAALKDNQEGTVVPVIVSVSPSASDAVTVYVYAASSVAVVTAVLVIVGASLALATAIVNESVTETVPSDAVITTAWFPTCAFEGVPVNAPELHVNQLGTVVQVRVTVSSSSVAVVVYEYATSSFAVVTAVLVISGASFAPVIVIVTVIVSDSDPSETVIVYCSVSESPVSKLVVSESSLSKVYVQTPLDVTANEPYVPLVELAVYVRVVFGSWSEA